LGEYKVRYLVLSSAYEIHDNEGTDYGRMTKQTVVEKISADSVEKAKLKAQDLATMRSKKTEKWILKAIEQVS